jgi:hypothetical protein
MDNMAAKHGKATPKRDKRKPEKPVKAEAPVKAAPPKVEKPREPVLPVPEVAEAPAKAIPRVKEDPSVKAAPVRDPALPPLPLPEPPPPHNPNRDPFTWTKERPKARPCHWCDKEVKLSTPILGDMRSYEPKDDEGMFMEWLDTVIVLVACAPCFRRGLGKPW